MDTLKGSTTESSFFRQVSFIDTGLPGYQALIDGFPEGMEVVLVAPDQDGIQVMADWAQSHTGYSAIHILGHGSTGAQQLGSTTLSSDTLNQYQTQLSQIGSSLTVNGDILLYGCNVAAEKTGVDFISKLAQATGADVAASDDLTGAEGKGGDWVLEQATGDVQTAMNLSLYESTLIPSGFSPVVSNASPSITGTPTDLTVTESTVSNIDLSAVSFADTDDDSLTVTLTASAGTFSTPADGAGVGSGVTGSKDSDTKITLVGSAADINTYLDTASNIQYTSATGDAAATITISASDGSLGLTSNPTVNLNINNAPVFGAANVSTQVSVFSYPNLNGSDSSPGSGNENANLASIVQNVINNGGKYTLDTSITSFAADNFATQLNSSGFFFMTDMENKSPTDPAFFPESAKTILRDWVSAGGVMMMTGTGGDKDTQFLNRIFDWDLTTESGSSWDLNSANAAGTPFADGASSLSYANATDSIGKGTVASFNPIYGTEDNAAVATITYDAGTVIFMGYDYYSSGIAGTGFTDHTQYTTDVSDGSSRNDAWVTEIIPSAMEYSAKLSSGTALTAAIGLTASNSLLVTDKNISDDVGVTVTSVTAQEKNSDGSDQSSDAEQPENAALLSMFSVSLAPISDGTLYQAELTWDFNSGDIGFNYLNKGEELILSYTLTADDGKGGTANQDIEITIQGANKAPTGTVTIKGTAKQGETLAVSNNLADPEGLGALSYEWFAGGVIIDGATGTTYTLSRADVGKTITVKASYTDQQGTFETVTSAATATVTNLNTLPTGGITINGTAKQGELLTLSNNLADADGLGTLSYEWFADGITIDGATGTTYTLSKADVGKTITVKASYTDQQGTFETVTSAATATVTNLNTLPTGGITINGTAKQGGLLTLSNNLADADGLGTLSYEWFAGGVIIDGATDTAYILSKADVGKTITVKASYIDQQGTSETVISTATSVVKATLPPEIEWKGLPDSDGDGIPESVEDFAPSADGLAQGDGNGDGIADREQSDVSSVPFRNTDQVSSDPGAPTVFITLAAVMTDHSDDNSDGISAFATLRDVTQQDAPEEKPNDLDRPLGLVSFKADVSDPGDIQHFSLLVDKSTEVNGYWKQTSSGNWVNLASEAYGGSVEQVGNKLQLNFVIEDGGVFDDDGLADGVITDPGALGYRESAATPELLSPFEDTGANQFFDWMLLG
ncbi:hypothetical protein BTA35_0209190 [Oceanospirillum linum]|uniref:DUF4347 domain-containing protein n=2 Tax=Oceanospirillum linum TaxID=966 RepID=A0A1T1HBD3_OCELI|nr:DUF4347 domain-containing protein [Oceanospirillum linum]OOV87159.1 hypothetical protein BTA35_0209190 [Oceanospirillum linum]SEF76476.1 protein of unknown function [Oleiphilus messinensis]SMP17522.1 protein of unknown function [Oceanospirillum linum]